MGSQKPREDRKPLNVPARMRLGEGWHDIVICNVSSRGLMARTRTAPPRGSFIEIRHGSLCIVGQVRWSAGARFGIRAQERIDIMGLLVGRKTAAADPVSAERRIRARPVPVSANSRAESSRRFARLFDWGMVVLAVAVVGVIVAEVAGKTLRTPLDRARVAMEDAGAAR